METFENTFYVENDAFQRGETREEKNATSFLTGISQSLSALAKLLHPKHITRLTIQNMDR